MRFALLSAIAIVFLASQAYAYGCTSCYVDYVYPSGNTRNAYFSNYASYYDSMNYGHFDSYNSYWGQYNGGYYNYPYQLYHSPVYYNYVRPTAIYGKAYGYGYGCGYGYGYYGYGC